MLHRNVENFIGCDSSYRTASIVLYGAPFDSTTSYRPGARFGPAAMRHESYGLETYSPYQDKDLTDGNVFDSGDLELCFGSSESALVDIESRAAEILRDGKLPLLLGGEHLVTLGAVRAAVRKYPDLHIVHFDAHADLRDDYLGAQALPSGETLSGVLTEWDGHDFYTFTLDAEEQVYLTANTTLESLMPNLTLYDGDMVKMSEEYGFKGYAEEFLLAAGTYYIDVWGNKGPYTLKAVYEEELPATVPAEEATEEEVDVQNESDSFDTAPEEGLTDPDSFTKELGSLLFDLLDSF